ncbi:DinB family protein [Flavobacterium sp. UBA7663]|uniref:DinB family protein n=1 Tax=Flavobacterium sp. UBA7663 TaxID=1946557 RepID=UPI0025C345AC|nr:DinB family protein [Flavobacterium sp. UBA7663]
MKDKILKLELLLDNFTLQTITNFELKINDIKWSKKEILGHLIDSAINNLQRFTEIQYYEKPYKIRPYNQDALVKYNHYQNKNNQDLFDLWLHLNRHILEIIKNQTDKSLEYQLILPNGTLTNLQFLIEDYIEHLFYHVSQITKHGLNT